MRRIWNRFLNGDLPRAYHGMSREAFYERLWEKYGAGIPRQPRRRVELRTARSTRTGKRGELSAVARERLRQLPVTNEAVHESEQSSGREAHA